MATINLPARPLRFVVEIALFALLCVPGIIWAGLKKLLPPKQKSVKGHVVLITGAARGLGRDLSMKFAKLGAKIACVDVIVTENDETARLIKDNGGVAFSYKCDVTDKEQVKALHKKVQDDLGPVDMLINNAGLVWGHSFVDPTKDQFIQDIINVNILGQIWMIREILPSMMDRNKGHVVAMSSLSSLAGVAYVPTYTATKWATNGMMESLDNELKMYNLDVKTTTITPYFVQTNPKVSKMLEIRIPEIPTDIACKLMVKGILEEQRIFSVPGHIFLVQSLIRLLPDNLQAIWNRISYTNIVLEESSDAIRKKYKRIK